MSPLKLRAAGLVAVGLTLFAAAAARGDDSLVVQSGSALTGAATISGAPVQQQAAGSLSTSAGGTMGVAALDLTALRLTFGRAATDVTLNNSGAWRPGPGGAAGSALANFGGVLDGGSLGSVDLAVRNLRVTFDAPDPVALTRVDPATYTFPADQQLRVTAGAIDYRGNGFLAAQVGSGSESLLDQVAANAGGTGTLTDLGGGNFRVAYPVSLTIRETVSGQPAEFQLTGTVTAQGSIAPVPEPAGVLAVAAVAAAAVRRARRRAA